jgi:predicted DsbA family dithiol-disulfide isomerase
LPYLRLLGRVFKASGDPASNPGHVSAIKLTYYLDVLSSWCFVVEGALAQLRKELGPRLEVDWRLAYLFGGGPMGYGPEMNAWFYRRTGSISGVKLNPTWKESADETTWFANLATQATRELGVTDDRVRLAMSRAAMVDGRHVGRRDVTVQVAAEASGLPILEIERAMNDPRTAQALEKSTQEYKALGVRVQPAFMLRNDIGDTAILSGLYRYETLAACADEMLAAADGYAAYGAANPQPA